MNVFTFSGNLGRDAELKHGSTSYVRFSVAVKSGYGEKQQTDWVDCILFGKRAETLAQYLVKGSQVVVSGEVKLNVFTKQDGSQGASIAVNVKDVTLVGSKPTQNIQTNQTVQNKPVSQADAQQNEFTDDIPF